MIAIAISDRKATISDRKFTIAIGDLFSNGDRDRDREIKFDEDRDRKLTLNPLKNLLRISQPYSNIILPSIT